MRAPPLGGAQAVEGKLVIEIVAAFELEDCLIAVSNVPSLMAERIPALASLVHISKTMFASASRRTCSVQGIAPFGEDIALLVYILEEGISSP